MSFKNIEQYHRVVLIVVLFFSSLYGFTQNLETITKEKLKVSGALNFNQTLYYSDGVDNRFNPYSYVANGNITASMYGFSVPITFTYSNQNLSYTTVPFNIVGLSPTYKSWTLHAGYRNMTFSKYTLAGHVFLGGGLEYKKDKWSFSGMGGRLQKAVAYDSLNSRLPVFERRGAGFKAKYTNDGDEISFILFYARDEANSLQVFPDSLGIRPLENQVYSLGFKKKLNEVITLHFEGARSGLNKDTRDTETSTGNALYFLPKNAVTDFSNAFNAGLDFKIGKGKLGAQVERVESNYQTLGAYMINSDFQNITVSGSTPMLKKKVNLSARAGFQRDDLNGLQISRMKRFVGSMNVSVKFSKKLNFTFAYSNFNSVINIKPVDRAFTQNTEFAQIDTLNFVQINQSVNGGMNFIPLESSNIRHGINLNANYAVSSNRSPGETIATSILGSNLGYQVRFKKTGLSIGLNANANLNQFQSGESLFAGLAVTSGFSVFKKKVKIRLSARANNNYENGTLTAKLYSLTNTYAYRLGKHHALNLSLRLNRRESIRQAELSQFTSTFNEFMGSLGYSYSF